MSEAFKCDRCEKLFNKEPMGSWTEEKLAWEPNRSSYPITVKIVMTRMGHGTLPGMLSQESIIEHPDLCKECFATIVRFAADKIHRPAEVAENA